MLEGESKGALLLFAGVVLLLILAAPALPSKKPLLLSRWKPAIVLGGALLIFAAWSCLAR